MITVNGMPFRASLTHFNARNGPPGTMHLEILRMVDAEGKITRPGFAQATGRVNPHGKVHNTVYKAFDVLVKRGALAFEWARGERNQPLAVYYRPEAGQ